MWFQQKKWGKNVWKPTAVGKSPWLISSVHGKNVWKPSSPKVLWSSLQLQHLTSSHLAQCFCAMASVGTLGVFGAVKEEAHDWSVTWFKQEPFYNSITIFIQLNSFPPSAEQPFRYDILLLPVRPMMQHRIAKGSRFLRDWPPKWRRPEIGQTKISKLY